MSKTFIDTNVLVYSVDNSDSSKRDVCRQHLLRLAREQVGVVSTQVLQEFYVVATRKLGLGATEAKALVTRFSGFETIEVSVQIILDAIDLCAIEQLSFWDSLILATAASARCGGLLTEDLGHGRSVRGVQILSPFAPVADA